MHADPHVGYGTRMAPRDPDDLDPADQHGRGLMVGGAALGLLVVLGAMLLVFVLSR